MHAHMCFISQGEERLSVFYVISEVKTRMNGYQSVVHSRNFLRSRSVQSGVICLVNQRAL